MASESQSPIRCAVIGYGPHHIFGRAHGRWIDATPDLEWVAVCDTNPDRLAAATDEFPHLQTYTDLSEMLTCPEIDMVSIVTPHHTHAPISLECIRAGKPVVVDKAMCLNVAEATAMIDAADKKGVMLAVFHARRHDGNYRAIVETVRRGTIGEVFHIELTAGGFSKPQDWWYNTKALGGGGFYYWGPHAIDWVLNLVGDRVEGVTGFYHKLVWDHVDVEDQSRAIMRFGNGTIADVTWSRIAAAGKPLWRILGTKGAIVDAGAGGNAGYQDEIAGPSGGSFQLITMQEGKRVEQSVPYCDSDWLTYYLEVKDHLLRGGSVPVTGEDGRRTIAVFEAAEESSATGRTESVQYE